MTEGSLADAVSTCVISRATGWDLVDQASRLVHDRFTTYSVLHAWERPQTSFRRRRGFCAQYNGALAQILRRLGVDARMVYAAGSGSPTTRSGRWAIRGSGSGWTVTCATSAHARPTTGRGLSASLPWAGCAASARWSASHRAPGRPSLPSRPCSSRSFGVKVGRSGLSTPARATDKGRPRLRVPAPD